MHYYFYIDIFNEEAAVTAHKSDNSNMTKDNTLDTRTSNLQSNNEDINNSIYRQHKQHDEQHDGILVSKTLTVCRQIDDKFDQNSAAKPQLSIFSLSSYIVDRAC